MFSMLSPPGASVVRTSAIRHISDSEYNICQSGCSVFVSKHCWQQQTKQAQKLRHELLKVSMAVQKHPWYQKGLPEGLQLESYNLHYVELSKAAANSTDLAAAIKRVMQACSVCPHHYS